METVVMSDSWIEAFFEYGRSRFPIRLFLPLAFFISIAAQVGNQGIDPDSLVISTLLALGLLFQFRLWDDLNDRARDRIAHPNRLLSKTVNTTHFHALHIAALIFNFILLVLLSIPRDQIEMFILLNGSFLLWYRWLHRYCVSRIIACHVILLKYPAFVYLLNRNSSEDLGLHLFLSMISVYFCFCIYELLHDQELHFIKSTLKVLFIEMSTLSLIFAIMTVELVTLGGRLAVLLQAMLVVSGVLTLVMLFKRHRAQLDLKHWRYSVFVIAFLQILWFSLSSVL